MNDDFPDPEDEFDLEHEDEYEILRELEATERGQNIPITSFAQDKTPKQTVSSSSQPTNKILDNQNSQLNDETVIETIQNRPKTTTENSKKRSIDQISQDACNIDDDISLYDFDDQDVSNLHKKKKFSWDQPEKIIEAILERKKYLQISGTLGNLRNTSSARNKSKGITKRVPKYEFIALTQIEDGNRIYIKVSEENKYVPKDHKSGSGFLIKSFDRLKDEAESIILKINKKHDVLPVETSNQENVNCELWVDKYRPKRYLDLMSDENVNRSLLYWLKLWDKIVFDRDTTLRPRKPQTFTKFKGKFRKKEDEPDYDSKGFPTKRIVLLTGPPGLGKTTLAHIAAKHAGYNIVEVNASDDRGPEAFREALLASTQMRAVIDQEKRPNCLVLDEIDGAPAASIDLLLKFVQGKLAAKGKNAKVQKENFGCRRPIICICNELYTPSLRPLRSTALVLSVPEASPIILAGRLSVIARKEGLHVDAQALLELAQRTACDVRACLGILQYTGGKTDMLMNVAFGSKDMRKGLFDSWKELLHVPTNKNGILSDSERVKKVAKIVQQGEPERLMQGIFHNYPELCKDKVLRVAHSMEWFEFYDRINTLVMERQNWILMPYTTAAFVTWHMNLSTTQVPKISFPSAVLEVNQKLERNMSILTVTKKISKYDILTLVTEVLPYLPVLLTPNMRTFPIRSCSPAEMDVLNRLVDLMLDFGLSYTQERRPEGGYQYILDPNLWDIATFPGCKSRSQLNGTLKQIVAQELEKAKIRRAAVTSGQEVAKESSTGSTTSNSSRVDEKTSNQTQSETNRLNAKRPMGEITRQRVENCRKFFERFRKPGYVSMKEKRAKDREMAANISDPRANPESDKSAVKPKIDLMKSDVHYQYKEGYTNAVRRKVLMSDLM